MMSDYRKGLRAERNRICEEVEKLIDHWTPYRPITDSKEAVAIRKALGELLGFIKPDIRNLNQVGKKE